jgi:hypothetical protein
VVKNRPFGRFFGLNLWQITAPHENCQAILGGFVTSRNSVKLVIPAKAGIQQSRWPLAGLNGER